MGPEAPKSPQAKQTTLQYFSRLVQYIIYAYGKLQTKAVLPLEILS